MGLEISLFLLWLDDFGKVEPIISLHIKNN